MSAHGLTKVYECGTCGARRASFAVRCACGGWLKAGMIPAEQSAAPLRLVREQPGGDYAPHGASADPAGFQNAATTQRPADDSGFTSRPIPITSAEIDLRPRISTGFAAVDRVLGGGIAESSLVLVGGDPGGGKSTLTGQILYNVVAASETRTVLYATGEETIGQVAERATRIKAKHDRVFLVAETDIAIVMQHADAIGASIIVMDSIQTARDERGASSAGTLGQLVDVAKGFYQFVKDGTRTTAVILIGHINKEGEIAGPKALEHYVDVTMHLAPSAMFPRLRVLKAFKNRFGSTSEPGVLEMIATGLVDTNEDIAAEAIKDPAAEWGALAQELLDRWQIQGGTVDSGIRERIAGRLDLDAWRAKA